MAETQQERAQRDREIIALSNDAAERVVTVGDYRRARAIFERFRREIEADMNKDQHHG